MSTVTKSPQSGGDLQSTLVYWISSESPGISHDDDDNDDVLLSADVYRRALPVLDRMLIVLQAIGLILNVTNIIVLTRPSMRSPTSRFLVAQSVLQLLYIVLRPLPALQRVFQTIVLTDLFYLIHGIYIINYALACLRRSMYCLQCLVSVERLLAVWMPLKAKQFLLVRRPGVFIVATPVLVFLVHIHITVQMEVFETTNPGNNRTVYSFRFTEHYRRYPQYFDGLGIALKTIFAYMSLLLLLVINVAIVGILKRSASTRKEMKTNVNADAAERRQSQMTLTILVSTFIFVFLCLPTASNSLATNVVPRSYGPFTKNRHLFLFINSFGVLLFFLAFSTDVFTYMFLSSAYRNTLLSILRMKRTRETLSSAKSR
ncbi:hypothetical protein ACOMHN_050024 [Nucella lapillus]